LSVKSLTDQAGPSSHTRVATCVHVDAPLMLSIYPALGMTCLHRNRSVWIEPGGCAIYRAGLWQAHLLRGAVGRREAAGPPVLIDRRPAQHGQNRRWLFCFVVVPRRGALQQQRHEALAAAVAVRSGLERLTAADRRQSLRHTFCTDQQAGGDAWRPTVWPTNCKPFSKARQSFADI